MPTLIFYTLCYLGCDAISPKTNSTGGGDEHSDYPFLPPYGGDMSNKILVVATLFAVVAIAVLIVPSSDDVDADSTKPFTVGDQTYITLSEAFDNVTDNGTISLNANASVDESTSLSDEKSITLDLNGFTLSTSKSITIGKDVSIILKDDSENGGGLFSSTKDFAINAAVISNWNLERCKVPNPLSSGYKLREPSR